MPCGTGSISLPLLKNAKTLTLIDISSNMLSIAKSNIPEDEKHKVTFINDDFFNIDIKTNTYDLVICLGLLAHVNSPEQLLNKLSHIIAPGGHLIIQNTDSTHFYSHLIRCYLGLKNIVSKQRYKLNKVKGSFVEQQVIKNGLQLIKTFRYNQSFLGLSNLFTNEKKYKLTRQFFGTIDKNKHAKWGSDVTYLFKK
jgi:ubiquinone/menaquinone biosynthesis C-methylase UbiE